MVYYLEITKLKIRNWLKANSYKLLASDGFTLLEAMASIFILLVGITGSLVLVSSGITNLNISKNRLIASNLAQEGLEVVHNIRDNNWLSSASLPWNDWKNASGDDRLIGDGVADSCNPCIGYVSWDSLSLGSSSFELMWNDNASVKHYDGAGTIGDSFSRIITITDNPDAAVPAGNSIKVQSTVGWGGAGSCAAGGINSGKKFCLTLEEWLYKWR